MDGEPSLVMFPSPVLLYHRPLQSTDEEGSGGSMTSVAAVLCRARNPILSKTGLNLPISLLQVRTDPRS